MPRFKKKPLVVEAIRCSDILTRETNKRDPWPIWLTTAYQRGDVIITNTFLEVVTPEGRMRAYPPDWIIRGAKGELYPCKNDIFEMTYDLVEEPSPSV